MPFSTVLVANRGEIARRVIRTLREQGITSVAIYSDPDATAPHVREADHAVRVGPAPAAESYMNIERVIAAAVDSGAEAVHPGYGFLSENADFARACADAGIVFIGPSVHALDVMGDKIRSKEHVAGHGVPTVPGFSAAGMSDDDIAAAADAAGYPLLIKPSAGGGGKGMHEVHNRGELAEALATARRVARASFGDETLLLERLITRPRHIEVQVLGDNFGSIIYLGERECTLQRRHQKVIEESPSAIIDEPTRKRLGAAACAAAASVDYAGAGTVEFLVSADQPDEFFFIEMNTRLQVEHPVTEMVTGVDLVQQQLLVAAGKPLALAQHDISLTGHAVEARVYAETPARGFLPATGRVALWQAAPGARTDSAVETGSVVSSHYDPMIAKVITHAATREEALAAADRALAHTVLAGVETNIDFLRTLLTDPDVRAGTIDTGFIDRMPPFSDPPATTAALSAAALCVAEHRQAQAQSGRAMSHASPLWRSGSGWRSAREPQRGVVEFVGSDGALLPAVQIPAVAPDPGVVTVLDGDVVWVHDAGVTTRLQSVSRERAARMRRAEKQYEAGGGNPDVAAPMPGAVVAVHVNDGDEVAAGARLVTIEAMKMEHPLTAPMDGTVRVLAAVGDQVRKDQVLAQVVATSSTDAAATLSTAPTPTPGE
ncbi:biotin carboxylase N-terminal domain-containing protein [Microbacterium sp. YY-01]|uniref:acetyl/propionyl/methylcrotonyl-CoA carboxylase subunit alpha n=1 Tax=Microbacterium sp. YY-01 TaxID=3421634 RepID=UPI003D171598